MIEKNITKYSFISIVLFVVGIILLIKSFSPSYINTKEIYSYQKNKSVDYTVKLKDSVFFKERVLGENRAYITNLVDDININFHYKYKLKNNTSLNYTYRIVNNIVVKYVNSTKHNSDGLWNKEYVLFQSENFNLGNQNIIEINENIILDFDNYNSQVENFKHQYGIPIEAYMEVKLMVYKDFKINENTSPISEQSLTKLKMNLINPAFIIEKDYKNIEKNNVYEDIKYDAQINGVTICISIIMIIGSIFIIINIIVYNSKKQEKNQYLIKTNKILKKYGDIIAEIITPIELENMKIIDLDNFEELILVEREIRIPILFYENIPGKEGEFLIVFDNIVYRYIIN